jgi:hypothetical protein
VLLPVCLNDFNMLSAGLPLDSARFATGCCCSGPGHSIARHPGLIGRAGVALYFPQAGVSADAAISLALHPTSARRRHAALRSPCAE